MKTTSSIQYHPKNRLLSVLLGLLFTFTIVAQNRTVTGSILDTQGMTVIGANVIIKGTSTGAISDMDGKFSISVPTKGNPILVVSYVGFVPQEIAVGSQSKLNIILKEDSKALDELVVVGYGVQKKSHLTGSVSKINNDNLTDIPAGRVDQVLQGKVAGISIQNVTSEAGQAPQIRVRGMGSISADASPLIVIDGYPVPDGLSTLDAADIESIEVLKDAASAAIYGSRAANGVILVSTKKGDSQKPKYTVKASSGMKWAYKLHPILTSMQYLSLQEYESPLRGVNLAVNDEALAYIPNNTDWQREGLKKTPMINSVQLSLSGGKKDVTYYLSGNYMYEDGIMVDSEYQRLNLRSRINAKLSERVDINLNIAPSYTKTHRPATNFIDFYRTPSFLPVRHTAETAKLTNTKEGEYAHGRDFNNIVYGHRPDGSEIKASPFQTGNNNPRSLMDNEQRFQEDYNLQANASLNVKILKNLIFTTSNGIYMKYRQNNEYRNFGAKKDGESAMGTYKNRLYIDMLSENTLNYVLNVGKHDFSVLAGYTAQTTQETTAGIVGLGFPTDYIHTLNAATELDLENTNTLSFRTAMMSVLGRANYSYADKYLVSLSARTDGSSLFAEGRRWGFFPSASLGWRLSEEEFMKKIDWISQLKLRGSFGITGNNNIPQNSYYDLLYASNYPLGSGNGQLVGGLGKTSSTRGNNRITWEQTYEYNYGVDFGVLNSRLNLSVEYYYSTTKQLLFKQPTLSFIGYNDYWNNIGRVRNSGVEIEINSVNIRNKKLEWSTSLNLSTNDNKLLALGGEERLISRGEREEAYLAQVGGPSIAFYGYKTDGVWLSQEQLDTHPHLPEDKPGGLRIVDINNDGIINDKDRTVIGSPFPKLNFGLSNNLKWNNFDLYVLIQGVQGVDVFNGDGFYNESKKYNWNYIQNRWLSPEFPGDGRTPYYTNGVSWQLTDYMIEDGSYIALRDVVLGYRFDKKALRAIGLKSLRLYASGQNLVHLSAKGYRGINPEARTTTNQYASPLINGYQRGGFPLQSTVSVGIELNF